MPTSEVDPIPVIVKTVKKLKPDSILDVGCGFGKYGFLFREQLDIIEDQFSNLENYIISRANWRRRIDGVEVFKNYICDIQRYIYSNIYIGNIVDLIDELNNYDVILLADIIEHFEKEEGINLLDKLYDKVNKLIIITTPPFEYEQDKIFNNEFEKHRSVWSTRDFKKYKNKKIININNRCLCIFIFKGRNNIIIPRLREKITFNFIIRSLIYTLYMTKRGTFLISYAKKIKSKLSS